MINLKTLLLISTGLVAGILVTVALLPGRQSNVAAVSSGVQQKPLYWVAPMDPDFRRDRPGKSPMGMDLVPVYAEAQEDSGPGTVRISPDVVNNLGVRTSDVTVGIFESVIRTVGHVTFDENQLVHIHPRVEGWIELMLHCSGLPHSKCLVTPSLSYAAAGKSVRPSPLMHLAPA